MKYRRIGVMCGSSEACDARFHEMAYQLGALLGKLGHDIVYGGGAKGLMRRVADGALDHGACVDGYIPEFMVAVEWQHNALTRLHITEDMAQRKQLMMQASDATLFLPGGCGTMEEFFEWLSSKRLGRYTGPLVIVNFEGFYDPLLELLGHMQQHKFHRPEHAAMWSVACELTQLPRVLEDAPAWGAEAIHLASVDFIPKKKSTEDK